MDKSPIVFNVEEGSIAQDVGIEKGDTVVSINDTLIKDVFDYGYLSTDEHIILKIKKKNDEIWNIDIEKDQYEDLGIEFETYLIDKEQGCRNKCVFCFIDQLPKGMRKSLYFKDDDSRLSYLTGNYVTLTNVDYKELDRIIKYKLSPINVSVHTTNPELRVKILTNKTAGDILDKMRYLIDGGIILNCQVVLCKDLNDKEELDRTLSDLMSLGELVESISVVPVGITKYRDDLYELTPYNAEESLEVIEQIKRWQNIFHEKYGSNVVYASDEFYVTADIEVPSYEDYNGFPQLENGVGMVTLLRYEVMNYLNDFDDSIKIGSRTVSIATGECAQKLIYELTNAIMRRFSQVKINVFPIRNDFFGHDVTVTGLLTGGDIYNQIKDKELGEELLLSHDMVKTDEDIFLDDMTVGELSNKLDIKICKVYNTGESFVNSILGIDGGKIDGKAGSGNSGAT